MTPELNVTKDFVDLLPREQEGRRKIRQVNWFDAETGKLLSTTTGQQKSAFGLGWAMFNKRLLRSAATNLPATALRVLVYLTSRQTYSEYVSMTWQAIADDLGIGRTAISDASRLLTAKNYVKPAKIDGQRVILLNPDLTACGRSSLGARRTLWHLADVIKGISNSPTPTIYNDLEEIRDELAQRQSRKGIDWDAELAASRAFNRQPPPNIDPETGEILDTALPPSAAPNQEGGTT